MVNKNKTVLLGGMFFLLFSFGFVPLTYGCGGHGHGEAGLGGAGSVGETGCPVHGDAATAGTEEAVHMGNKVCPVMGSSITERTKVTHEHEGKIYNFCCPPCVDAFNQDPGKYIEKISG